MSGPWLDVSDVLLDPTFADRFDVTRRQEVVNDFGESTVVTTPFANQIGVFTASSANDLQRLEEQDRMGRNMTLVTKFRLRGPSKDSSNKEFKPDLVVWSGDTYVVKHLDLYHRFGPGFVQAIVGSVDSEDAPP